MDPLAEQFPAWNPYHYVHNNPINMIDPTGMSADGWRENKETGEKTFSKDYTKENTPKEFNYADEILSGSEGKYYDSSGGITDVGTVLPEIEMTKKSSLHPYYNAVPSGEYGAYNPDGTGLTVYGSFFGTSLSLSLVSDNSNRFALFTSYSAGFGYNTPNFKLLGFGATFDVYNNYGTGSLFDGISGPTMDYSAGYHFMGGRSIPLNPETGEKDANGVFKTSGGVGKGFSIGQSKTRRLW